MSAFSDSYVSRVLLATPPQGRGLDVVMRAVALAEDLSVRPVPARAALHARPRPEMANEARAQCWVRELIGNDRGIHRQELDL